MFIVQVAGNLGKDPETRFTPSGQKVTSFTIASNQRKGKEDVTLWVRITIWGDRFDKMMSYVKKGSGIIVVGRMTPPSTYTDKEGRSQVTLEVTAEMLEFLPSSKTERTQEGGDSQGGAPVQSRSNEAYGAQAPKQNYGYQSGGYESPAQNKQGGYAASPGPSYGGSQNEADADDTLPF